MKRSLLSILFTLALLFGVQTVQAQTQHVQFGSGLSVPLSPTVPGSCTAPASIYHTVTTVGYYDCVNGVYQLRANSTGAITSVGLTLPSIFTVTGSPITTGAGTLAATFASQVQNLFLASPNGASGALTMRAIVAADLPSSLTSNTTGTSSNVTGIVAAANGGSGVASPAAHSLAIANATSPFTFLAPGTSGTCLMSNGAALDPSYQTCPSGGGGTPAGSLGNLQYNNSGVFGALATTISGANITFPGTITATQLISSGGASSIVLNGSTSGSTTFVPSAVATGTLTFQNGPDTVVNRASTDVFTNKTFDTGGVGNLFKIAGVSVTALSGNTGTVATTSGVLTNGDCTKLDINGNIVDAGAACGAGGSGTSMQLGGAALSATANLSNTTPAAGTGFQNVQWQKDASATNNVSGEIPPATSSATGVMKTGDFLVAAADGTVQPDPSSVTGARDMINLWDDFVTGSASTGPQIGSLGWGNNTITTAPSYSYATTAFPHLGIVQIQPAATANTGGAIALNPGGQNPFSDMTAHAGYSWSFGFKQSATTNIQTYVGFSNSQTTQSPANFIGLRYDTGAAGDTAFKFVCVSGGTTTAATTTYTTDALWHNLTISSTTAGTISFQLDANTAQTISTGCPTNSMAPLFEVTDTTITQNNLQIDYFGGYWKGLGR